MSTPTEREVTLRHQLDQSNATISTLKHENERLVALTGSEEKKHYSDSTALLEKLEMAEDQFADAIKSSQTLSQTNKKLSQALEESKEDLTKMRNEFFNNKLKLAQAESRADSLQYAREKELPKTKSSDVEHTEEHPDDEGRLRESVNEDLGREKVLEKSSELEEANQEILTLRLQLVKAKPQNEKGSRRTEELA